MADNENDTLGASTQGGAEIPAGMFGRSNTDDDTAPETFDPTGDDRVDADEEAERGRLLPQQPRSVANGERLDETVPGGKYFHVVGNQVKAHDAHGREIQATYPRTGTSAVRQTSTARTASPFLDGSSGAAPEAGSVAASDAANKSRRSRS